jgi:hypothetical protein
MKQSEKNDREESRGTEKKNTTKKAYRKPQLKKLGALKSVAVSPTWGG